MVQRAYAEAKRSASGSGVRVSPLKATDPNTFPTQVTFRTSAGMLAELKLVMTTWNERFPDDQKSVANVINELLDDALDVQWAKFGMKRPESPLVELDRVGTKKRKK